MVIDAGEADDSKHYKSLASFTKPATKFGDYRKKDDRLKAACIASLVVC
jgi:hypothetical protein